MAQATTRPAWIKAGLAFIFNAPDSVEGKSDASEITVWLMRDVVRKKTGREFETRAPLDSKCGD